jgi:hypothetical protein
MDLSEATRRLSALSAEAQLRLLASFGHNLTVAARDTYEFQAPGVREPMRLRQINEIQHRVLAHILALSKSNQFRYPDDVLISIMLEHDDGHLRAQALWAGKMHSSESEPNRPLVPTRNGDAPLLAAQRRR